MIFVSFFRMQFLGNFGKSLDKEHAFVYTKTEKMFDSVLHRKLS